MTGRGARRGRRHRARALAGCGALMLAAALVGCTGDGTGTDDPAPTSPGATALPSTGPSPSASGDGTSGDGSSGADVPAPTTEAPPEAPAGDGRTPGPTAHEPVDPVERPRADAVPLDEPAAPATGVRARLVDVEQVDGEASGPGEVAGAAVRVTVELDNGSRDPLDLRGAVVNLFWGDERLPASTLSGPGAADLPADLAPGASARGTFVYRVEDPDAHLEVEVDVADAPRVVVFEGRA